MALVSSDGGYQFNHGEKGFPLEPMTVYYEDMPVGKKFTSESKTLSQGEVDRFAELTGDMNRLHIDEEYARRTIFRGRVAHGLLVLSLAIGLWYDMGLTRDSLVALLGIDQVSFRAPVRAGDRLHLASRVQSRRPSKSNPEAGIVVLHDVIADRLERKLVEFERVLLVKRRPKA